MRLWRRTKNIFDRYWDYYYLKNQLNRTSDGIDTIVAGSSYAIFGLNFRREVLNLALPSQDIYYADKLIRVALGNCKNAKKVILCAGYYSFHCDLSKTVSKSEHQRIADVYLPILGDPHHATEDADDAEDKILRISAKDLILKLYDEISSRIVKWYLQKNDRVLDYFDSRLHTRERRKLTMWSNPSISWWQLSKEERMDAARKRTVLHEKNFKFSETYIENKDILRKLHELCRSFGIQLCIFLPPFSMEYNETCTIEFRHRAQEVMDDIRQLCDIFKDFNGESGGYMVEDFVDSDHLSDKGAEKFTSLIF